MRPAALEGELDLYSVVKVRKGDFRKSLIAPEIRFMKRDDTQPPTREPQGDATKSTPTEYPENKHIPLHRRKLNASNPRESGRTIFSSTRR